jgi:hypothetical protein
MRKRLTPTVGVYRIAAQSIKFVGAAKPISADPIRATHSRYGIIVVTLALYLIVLTSELRQQRLRIELLAAD